MSFWQGLFRSIVKLPDASLIEVSVSQLLLRFYINDGFCKDFRRNNRDASRLSNLVGHLDL
jgi:hypothetical protein